MLLCVWSFPSTRLIFSIRVWEFKRYRSYRRKTWPMQRYHWSLSRSHLPVHTTDYRSIQSWYFDGYLVKLQSGLYLVMTVKYDWKSRVNNVEELTCNMNPRWTWDYKKFGGCFLPLYFCCRWVLIYFSLLTKTSGVIEDTENQFPHAGYYLVVISS